MKEVTCKGEEIFIGLLKHSQHPGASWRDNALLSIVCQLTQSC